MSFVDRAVILDAAKAALWPGYESVVTYPVPSGPSSVLIDYDLGGTRALVVREMEQTTVFEKDGVLYVAQLTGADDWDAALEAMRTAPPGAGWTPTDLAFDHAGDEVAVFSATFAGDGFDHPDQIAIMDEMGSGTPTRVPLAAGRYRVEEIPRHERNGEEWYLARLVRV